jgi:hypothetical protein
MMTETNASLSPASPESVETPTSSAKAVLSLRPHEVNANLELNVPREQASELLKTIRVVSITLAILVASFAFLAM